MLMANMPMDKSSGEKISEQEAFELAYHYFFQALEILASDAKTQCERVGNYNVAWELKNDVSGVIHMFNLSERLLREQKSEILGLVAALDAIPSEILRTATNAADNLNAMNHPCWVPLRKRAAELIKLLEPATKKNEAFFKSKAN
jgi:hypothetical protein